MALGGADVHYAQAGGLVALALGIGLMRPGPCGHLHLLSASAVGVAAWILPALPRTGAMVILLGMVLPLTIVARRFGQVFTPTHSGSRAAMLIGFCLGLILVNFGTGPWLFLFMVVGILLPPPAGSERLPLETSTADSSPTDNASSDSSAETEGEPTALQQVAIVMIAMLGGALLLALHPYLTLFDDGSVLQDTRRAVALAGLFALGWWLLGSAIGDNSRFRYAGATVLCGIAAFSVRTTTTTAERLSEPKIFGDLSGWKPLMDLIGRTKPMTEEHWVWVPAFTVVLAALPVIAWAAAMRAALGPRKNGIPTPMATGLSLLGFGLAYLVIGGMDHRFSNEGSLTSAFAIALVAAIACAGSAPLKVGLPALVISFLIPFSQGGVPDSPLTGNPFRDWFQYQIAKNNSDKLGQRTGDASVARVLDRGGVGSVFGTFFLADGRNVLTPTPETERLWTAESLFPLVLKGKLDRALYVGTPHGPSVRALKQMETRAVHWAVDPPELVEVAWGYQPGWLGLELNGVTATAAQAEGKFDYVFIRENATWEQRRVRSMRKAGLRHAARKLVPGGVLAVAIDPTRALPGMISRVGEAMADAVGGETRYWILPHGIRVPGLVLTVQKDGGEGRQDGEAWTEHPGAAKALEALHGLGYPLRPSADLSLMEFHPHADESEYFDNLLDGPLPNVHLALASTARFGNESMLPFHRAGRVLAGLGEDGSLPWVMATHEQAQIFDLPDNQMVADEKKLDFDFATFQGLLELARLHPNSMILQRTCEVFSWATVENREVEWNMAFTSKLVDEVGWRTPSLLWAYASGLTEMLEPEAAEKLVMEALEIDPNHELAGRLLKHLTGEENLQLESRAEREGHTDH